MAEENKCGACQGSGLISPEKICEECAGSGVVSKPEEAAPVSEENRGDSFRGPEDPIVDPVAPETVPDAPVAPASDPVAPDAPIAPEAPQE